MLNKYQTLGCVCVYMSFWLIMRPRIIIFLLRLMWVITTLILISLMHLIFVVLMVDMRFWCLFVLIRAIYITSTWVLLLFICRITIIIFLFLFIFHILFISITSNITIIYHTDVDRLTTWWRIFDFCGNCWLVYDDLLVIFIFIFRPHLMLLICITGGIGIFTTCFRSFKYKNWWWTWIVT